MLSEFERILVLASACATLVVSCSGTSETTVLGDSVKCTREESKGVRSSILDGNTVVLRAARGETLGLQVFPADEHGEVSLILPRAAARIEAFRVGYVRVTEASTEMYGASSGTGTYPDVLFPVDAPVRGEGHVYFDVSVPLTARPGRYEGQLLDGGATLAVVLTVDAARIDVTRYPLVWAFYHPRELARAHGVADDDGPREIEVERRYHELFRKHGVLFATNLRPARFPPRARFVRDVAYWPVSVDFSNPDALEGDVSAWLEHFRERGVTPFTIPIDEPATMARKSLAKRVADEIGAAGGGAPRLLRAVTDRVSPVYGDSIDAYFSPDDIPRATRERRAPGKTFWTYNGRPPQAGSMIIDTDGAALRTWGWIAFRYALDLWYAWEGAYFSDRYNGGGPTNVFSDPLTFDERTRGGADFGNGDGLLVYPGPLPSLRLKALRRGLMDRLLLLELSNCGGSEEASVIARRIVPRALGEAGDDPAWPERDTAWERARIEVLDAIARRCQ